MTSDVRKAYDRLRRCGEDAATALSLARAYNRAEACGLCFVWEEDVGADLSWLEEGEVVNECLCLLVYSPLNGDGEEWDLERTPIRKRPVPLACIGGVCDPDRDHSYRLCASLAIEALAALECRECGTTADDYALPWHAESGTCGICADRLKEAGVIEW